VIALAFLATLASDSWGQSKQPPSKQTAQPPATDPRGTDQVPLAVKILPATDAKEQAEKSEHDRKEKAAIDEKLAFETQRIANYTTRLAWFTLMLFGVAVLQAGLFLWQLGYMRKGMKDATIAARAASRSATATVAQAKVARNSAIKLQRPYIFVFGVQRLLRDVPEFYAEFTIANFGAIPAIIEDVFVGFVFSDRGEPPMPLRMGDDHTLSTNPIFAAGERRDKIPEYIPDGMDSGSVVVNFSEGDPLGEDQTSRISPTWNVPPNSDVFFRVVVRYRGPFSAGHETAAM
jgi:hypothetical protein